MTQVYAVPKPREQTDDPPATKGKLRLRAWMLVLPVDFAAFVAPLSLTERYWKGVLVAAALNVVLFAAGGLYQARRHLSILDDLPSLCGRMLVAVALVGILVAARHGTVQYLGGFLRLCVFSAAAVLAGRTLTCLTIIFARRRRWIERRALVVSGGPVAAELARLLRRYPQYGLRFAGFVDVQQQDLAAEVRRAQAEVVIIGDTDCPEAMLLEIARSPMLAGDLWVVPRLREFHSHGGRPDHVGAIPLVRVRRPALAGPKWAVKRLFDIVFATVALVLLGPVLLVCAAAAFIACGHGVFFLQQRIGRYGRPFNLVKFRTLRPHEGHDSRTTWSVADDAGVGRIGRFLRRTSLDELPQLWNILRGDMTVVGPRPERPYFVDRFSADYPGYAMRHRVPVGLTGLAQVSGLRGDTPISDRARFDNYYIENWSIWLDIKVLLRTVAVVLRGTGK